MYNDEHVLMLSMKLQHNYYIQNSIALVVSISDCQSLFCAYEFQSQVLTQQRVSNSTAALHFHVCQKMTLESSVTTTAGASPTEAQGVDLSCNGHTACLALAQHVARI